ncbi:hypothetical protein IWQ62_006256, partial [Dispira parvispora]
WLAGNPYHAHPECRVLLFFTFQAKGRTICLDGQYPTPGETTKIKQLFCEYDDPEITPLVNGVPSTNSISHRVLPPSLVQHTGRVPVARPVLRSLSINKGSGSVPLHATHSKFWTSPRRVHRPYAPIQSQKGTTGDELHIAGNSRSVSLAELPRSSHQFPPPTEPTSLQSNTPSAQTATGDAESNLVTRPRVLRLAELTQRHKPLVSSRDDLSTSSSSPTHSSFLAGTSEVRTQSLYAPTSMEPSLNSPTGRTRGIRLGSSPDSVSSREPLIKFRQRIEAMRSQAGNTWLKAFQEMQATPGSDREPFQKEVLLDEEESRSTESSVDDPVSASLPEFLFPQSALSHRPPLPPRVPTLQTQHNTELERVSPESSQPQVTNSAVASSESSSIHQSVTSPFHSEENAPAVIPVSAKDEPCASSPVPTIETSLLPSHAMTLLVSAAQYDYLPDQGLFSGQPRTPPVARWLVFVPAPYDADALSEYVEDNPVLLEYGSDGSAQPSEVLTRIPLRQLLTVVANDPTQARQVVSASTPSGVPIILDLKASQYERPIRVAYTIENFSATSADGWKSG